MAKTVFTNQQVIAQIDSGSLWTTNGGVAGTITYGVTTNRSWFPSNYGEYAGWSALNTKQAAAANLAIELWDDLIASDIVLASNPNNADIRFSNSSTGVNYAHAYLPGATGVDSYAYQKAQGSVWFNPSYTSLSDPDVGEYGFMAVIHEIGHALGLDHPGEYNGGSPTYDNNALYEQDTHMWTAMSYFDAENTGADWYASDGWWKYAQTPMLHDILTIQSIYGADMSTRSGDTVYGFNSTAGRSVFDFTQNIAPVVTIWDGGGTDTLDFSGWNTASQISLVAGTFSHTNSMTHNIAIAFGAQIENAVGGGGNDQITGNDLNNVLSGLGGNDTINGNDGNDTINGNDGNDWIDGGQGVDTLFGGAGDDTIVFDALDNLAGIDGGAGVDTLRVNGGSLPVFDLSAHGFEFAERVQTDAGGAAWATKTDHYDAAWVRTRQDGVNDDGSSWQTVWDTTDTLIWSEQTTKYDAAARKIEEIWTYDDGLVGQTLWDTTDSFIWSEQTIKYDTADRKVEETLTYDDGLVRQTLWDADDSQEWSRVVHQQDGGNNNTWTQQSTYFDDLNRYYEQTVVYDDGRTLTSTFDVNNAETWWRQDSIQDVSDVYSWINRLIHFDDQYRRIGDTILLDDGREWSSRLDVTNSEVWSRSSHLHDRANNFDWSETSKFFDDQGRRYEETGIYDDGRTWQIHYDVENTETWSRQEVYQDVTDIHAWTERSIFFDDQDRQYGQTDTLDDGQILTTQWDVDGAEVWSRQETYQDVTYSHAWTERSIFFDDQDRQYGETVTLDDGQIRATQWDVDGAEVWSRQETYQDVTDIHAWTERSIFFDDQDRQYGQTDTLDNGQILTTQWDVDGAEVWSRHETYKDVTDSHAWTERSIFFDEQNRRYDQTVTLDNGQVWNAKWDVDDAEAWSRQVTGQDAANASVWAEVTSVFDDQNRLHEQTGTYDRGHTWRTQYDVDDHETWSRQTQIFDTLDQYAWSERVLQFDSSNTLISHIVIDDVIV